MDKVKSGQQLSDRYTLKDRLSMGGMGEVWLAHDNVRQQNVVLKFLSTHLATNASAQALLQREFDQARRLIHPNIVRALGLETIDHRLCLVSEFAGSRTTEILKHGDYREFLPTLLPILDALSYAHSAGLIHRDIKPSNIVLGDDDTPRLADFGLSLEQGAETDLSGGSLFYMSPQQLAGDTPDPRDDIYSFGATLYELINGQPPFYPNISEDRIRSEVPSPLKSTVVLPTGLDALIFSMLSKRREERPESFAEIKQRLLDYIDVADNRTAPPEHIVAGGMEPIHATSFEQSVVEPSHFTSADEDYVPTTPSFKSEPTVSVRSAAIALAIAVVAVGLVVFLLPKFAPTVTPDLSRNTSVEGNEDFGEITPSNNADSETPAAANTETPQGEAATTTRAPYEEATFQRERSEAQDFTLALLRQQMALEDKKVTVWAPDEYKKAQALGDHGDALFREERFGEAMDSYYQAETVLIELTERADGVLDELLSAGQTAIDALDQETAEEAFDAVLRIDAANARAITGLEITEAIPTISALLESGDAKFRAGELRDARSDYDEVLKIYPGNQVAIDEETQGTCRKETSQSHCPQSSSQDCSQSGT
ncbi:MAG: protein kinase, partial [Pseudomonadota bacterium]